VSPSRSTLMLFVEPTLYVLGLVRAIIVRSDYRVEALFSARDVSQLWRLSIG